jgi:S-adenosylmethionine:tRNA ribosyltransferase-isomerase
VGTILDFGEGQLQLKCIEVLEEGIRRFSILTDGIFIEILNDLGIMPLPPYIKAKLKDQDRYQTVYAKHLGSVAAPTAGLHFTPELLQKLSDKGVILTYITLHVGLATFKPVEVDEVEKHQMHSEIYEVNQTSADILNQAKRDGRRIIAVGTTSLRTLESQIQRHGCFKAEMSSTSIFIYPGQRIQSVDALITNFHLPKSTLLMLVSALSSLELMKQAYQLAIEKEYRFFSFGDAMLILCNE